MNENKPFDCSNCGLKSVSVWKTEKTLFHFDEADEDDPGYKESGQYLQQIRCAECGAELQHLKV